MKEFCFALAFCGIVVSGFSYWDYGVVKDMSANHLEIMTQADPDFISNDAIISMAEGMSNAYRTGLSGGLVGFSFLIAGIAINRREKKEKGAA